MRHNLTSTALICLLILIVASSCKRKEFLMDIRFGLAENLIKQEASKLAKKGELLMEMKDGDTTFYRNIDVDGIILKAELFFNGDRLKTGPLREYSYSFPTTPFAQSGNDTVSQKGYRLRHLTVLRASDFEKLKLFLDKKFGQGVLSNVNKRFWNFTTYKYETKEADLFLVYGKKVVEDFLGAQVKSPFYETAYVEIKSKTYSSDFEKEQKIRKGNLKPEEVLGISFDPPKLRYDGENTITNSLSHFSAIPDPNISISARSEIYKTFVIDDDITECKGILSITDAYNDTITKMELIYKFKTPLKSPVKQEVSVLDYNTYNLI